MLLAEGLAARKQAMLDISALSSRVQEVAVRYEDEKDDDEDANELIGKLEGAIDDFESLSVRINKTNNKTSIKFDGRDLTVMEAIAFREALMFRARHLRAIADHVSAITKSASLYGRTRTKEDIKQVSTINAKEIRARADSVSLQVRRLDVVLQQANWSTELE